MDITGEYRIPARQEAVWAALNDPDVLRRALPGCQTLEQTGAQEFTATVTAKVGPVSATFKGKVELSDLDPPHGYTLSGRGQGGPAGFARGSARVRLEAEAEGLDKVFTDFGAEWRFAGCSMCLGMNPDQLAPGERCASTSNRNFEGRQGKGGRTHLVSPLVAAATAIRGTLSSPWDLEASA